MIRTYTPAHIDVDAEIKRAKVVAMISILAGLAFLFGLSGVAIVARESGVIESASGMISLGMVLMVVCVGFGLVVMWWHTAFPQRRNADELAAEAAHQREIERGEAESARELRVIEARTRQRMAEITAERELARLSDTAATREIKTATGATLFPPRAPVPPLTDRTRVQLSDGNTVRIDLVREIAHRWPVRGDADRETIRKAAGGFRNTEYTAACRVVREYLGTNAAPTPLDAQMCVVKIRHSLPAPEVAVPAENTAEQAGNEQGTGNG